MSEATDTVDVLQERIQALTDVENELDQLVASLLAMPTQVDRELRSWPTPPPPKRQKSGALVRTRGPMPNPLRVLAEWRQRGLPWLKAIRRRDLRAVLYSLTDAIVCEALLSEPQVVAVLSEKTRGLQRNQVLALALFSTFPPKESIWQQVVAAFATGPAPGWWSEVLQRFPDPKWSLQAWNAKVFDGTLARPGDLSLPAAFWDGPWPAAILEAADPRSVAQAEQMVRFSDAGAHAAGHALSPATVAAVQQAMSAARVGRLPRRDVASLVARRVGSPFDPAAQSRWALLGPLQRQVRTWLAGEVLDILFRHMVPPDSGRAHMTKPRRAFWHQYTGSVRRIWILVPSRMRKRMEHSDVRTVRELLGSSLQILGLRGQSDQCIVWMHLEGTRGIVTAIEGNANTTLRIAHGEFVPPAKVATYRDDIVHGPLSGYGDSIAETFVHDGGNIWMDNAERILHRMGIARERD